MAGLWLPDGKWREVPRPIGFSAFDQLIATRTEIRAAVGLLPLSPEALEREILARAEEAALDKLIMEGDPNAPQPRGVIKAN